MVVVCYEDTKAADLPPGLYVIARYETSACNVSQPSRTPGHGSTHETTVGYGPFDVLRGHLRVTELTMLAFGALGAQARAD